ncbi:ATP-binding protein [Streptomyces zhihengii]
MDDFVGREAQLTRLAELAEEGGTVVVSGPPGAGKATLALHAARQLADRFPGGRLMVDLRGMDDTPPVTTDLCCCAESAGRDGPGLGGSGTAGLPRAVPVDAHRTPTAADAGQRP